jgi:thioesterase domain-containing protein
VVLFPGLGGDDRELAALRNGTASGVRCVTLAYPDWTDIYTKPIDLDGLIAHCVAQVNALVPHGAVRLAGYSFGGTMAYEVAVALTASGREVVRLGLLDSPAKPFVATKPPSLKGRWRRFETSVRDGGVHKEIAGTIAGLAFRTRSPRVLLALGRLRRFRLPLHLEEHLNKPITCRFREGLLLKLIDRMQTPRPPLHVPSVLFRSERQHLLDAGPDLGWGRYLTSLEIVNLKGDHHTVIKPENIGTLCKAFVDAMGDYRAAAPMAEEIVNAA